MNKNADKNINNFSYWPYSIILIIIAGIVACVYTVWLSFDYPVDSDESYFMSYQNVKNNFNEIQKSEELFDENFTVKILAQEVELKQGKKNAFLIDKAELKIEISSIKEEDASKLISLAKLTRPHTRHSDMDLELSKEANIFTASFKDFDEMQIGRWTLLVDFANERMNKFLKLELCIKTCQ